MEPPFCVCSHVSLLWGWGSSGLKDQIFSEKGYENFQVLKHSKEVTGDNLFSGLHSHGHARPRLINLFFCAQFGDPYFTAYFE